MKILTLVTFIILIMFMIGCKKKDEINRLIKENFNDELIIKEIFKEYPSESLKKWDGTYKIILTDKKDKENFSVSYKKTDKLEEVLKEALLNRDIKDKFIKKQKVAVENIKKNFKEPFIQMFEIDTAFGSLSSCINFFLEKKVFKENKDNIIKDLLIKVDKNIINTYNRIYISSIDENFKIEKNYYGYIENGVFYRMNESSFGSNTDFYISKNKFSSPMYGLNKDLREKFMELNEKISVTNYFYKNTGLFMEIKIESIFYNEIEKNLKMKLGKGFEFITGYIDKVNDKIVIKGIVLNDTINPTALYEFIYDFQTEELILTEK
ncbi:MAG: hypothetical protein ACRCXY_10795 [Fusobacteriaceae bacterium]